jgi:hypothetical protein
MHVRFGHKSETHPTATVRLGAFLRVRPALPSSCASRALVHRDTNALYLPHPPTVLNSLSDDGGVSHAQARMAQCEQDANACETIAAIKVKPTRQIHLGVTKIS